MKVNIIKCLRRKKLFFYTWTPPLEIFAEKHFRLPAIVGRGIERVGSQHVHKGLGLKPLTFLGLFMLKSSHDHALKGHSNHS